MALATANEVTLGKSIVLAFFLTLVLELAESVTIQSLAATIQALRAMQPTWRRYAAAFRREAGTALLFGSAVRRQSNQVAVVRAAHRRCSVNHG
jgi:magnesium transporter